MGEEPGGKFLHLLDIPCLIRGEIGHTRFHDEFIKFKKTLEEHIGRDISDEALSESIRVHNENRSLLKENIQPEKKRIRCNLLFAGV